MNAPMVVPANDHQVAELLASKPEGWEYYLFAATLQMNVEKLEVRFEDYELGYAPRLGTAIGRNEFMEYVQTQLSEARLMVGTINELLSEHLMTAALGSPGVPGNPDKIIHAAWRIVRLYSDLLSWAERIRGQGMRSELREISNRLIKLADQPIRELRNFANRYVAEAEKIPSYLARNQPVVIQLVIHFEIPREASVEFSAKLSEYVK